MAQVLIQRLIDDLDGTDITDDDAGGLVSFAFQGVRYEIDLSAENYSRLEALLQPYIAAGRQIGGKRTAPTDRSETTGSRSRRQTASARSAKKKSRHSDADRRSEIRQWARLNGYAVSERGRINGDVVAAFEAAQ